ncbi:MAG: T9SS type A sorting domain-containing protein [Saprospiraceae bacterium]|nr:T9SS type A sorting domain-containing protein [Saprospiraceae bacterium]
MPNPFVNPDATTTYFVEINDGTDSIERSLEIVVFPLAPRPSITASGDSLISSSPVNNQWFFYGAPISGATEQVHHPMFDGSYQVQVLDENGCPSPLSEPYEYFTVSTGSVLSEKQWMIVPNPATNELSILGNFDDRLFTVEIWSSTGALILRERNVRTISVADLPAGLYWVRLNTQTGSGIRRVSVLR